MKKTTKQEYDNLVIPARSWIGPLIRTANEMFAEDSELKIIEVEPEDIPEEHRCKFKNSSELQRLAGLFRQRITPLDDLRVSCRNGKLFLMKIDNKAVFKRNRK